MNAIETSEVLRLISPTDPAIDHEATDREAMEAYSRLQSLDPSFIVCDGEPDWWEVRPIGPRERRAAQSLIPDLSPAAPADQRDFLRRRIREESARLSALVKRSDTDKAAAALLVSELAKLVDEASAADLDGTDSEAQRLALIQESALQWLRFGLVSGPVKKRRERYLGLRVWPIETIEQIEPATALWLGQVVFQRSTLTPEKKSSSGS